MAAMQIEQLRSRVRGAIVQPDGESYESVRLLYNRMIDKRPALIVRCVDVADVIAAVDFARTNNLLTPVKLLDDMDESMLRLLQRNLSGISEAEADWRPEPRAMTCCRRPSST